MSPLTSSKNGAQIHVDEFEVVVHDEVLREQMVVAIHLREGQTPSHIPAHSLPQCAVPTLDMRRLPATLIDRLMTTPLEDLRIGHPEVAVARAVPIARWNTPKEPTTGLLAAVSKDKGDHLTRAPTQRELQPTLVLFLADKAIKFIEFKHVLGPG